jgi:dihydroorotate dehydrogenase (fumarate)
MEDAGASAVVLYSLFEEQIRYEHYRRHARGDDGDGRFPEALAHLPEGGGFRAGPEEYCRQIARAKEAVRIPIMGSLNGTTFGGWTTQARQIEQAGADALELNLYSVPTDSELSSEEIEQGYLTVLASLRGQLNIPIAVKLGPFFTNLSGFARRLEGNGANGLVLFNRFYQPDIELETRDVSPNIWLSTSMDSRLPLRWIALLHGRIGCSLAATSGIHRGTDALKLIMAGADVTMLCSVLLRRGLQHLAVIEREMRAWIDEHEINSIEEIKDCVSQQNCADPSAYERAHYMRGLSSMRGS